MEGSCECCGDFLIEIKCPYSVCETIPTAENLNYLTNVDSKVQLRKTHGYYTQIQGQLALTGKTFAWFYVYTHHGDHIEKIEFDKEHWAKVKDNLVFLWNTYLGPELLKKRTAETEQTNADIPLIDISNATSGAEVTLYLDSKKALPKPKKSRKRKLCKEKNPKLYLCFVCGDDCIENPNLFKENSICCTVCKNWLHFKCVNISNENDIPSQNKKWLCRNCEK